MDSRRPPEEAVSRGGRWRQTVVMTVVMLTGASGFLGIHVLQRLLDDGHRVRAFVRTPAKLRENLALLGVDPDDAAHRRRRRRHDRRGRGSGGGERLRPGLPRRRHVLLPAPRRGTDAAARTRSARPRSWTRRSRPVAPASSTCPRSPRCCDPARPWTTRARWVSRSARTPRARWTPSASHAIGRNPVPRSPSSTRAPSSARTTPTSARATRSSVTSCGPPPHLATGRDAVGGRPGHRRRGRRRSGPARRSLPRPR